MCSKVDGLIKLLQDSDQYISSLRHVTLATLIRQVSQVYETINYSRLLHISHFGTQFQIEHLLVECVRHNDMHVDKLFWDCILYFVDIILDKPSL